MEVFIDIVGFDNYQVSSFGKIKNKKSGRILSENPTERGYMKVNLMWDGRSHTKRVHKLVCEHFNPNPGQKPQVDHRDEDKANNRADNLRWCTHQENIDYYYEKDPSRKYQAPKRKYKITDIMKPVRVNGIEFVSAGSAADYICGFEPTKKKATVSKEIRKMIGGKRSFGVMYGKYEISKYLG